MVEMKAAQAQLRQIARDLEIIKYRMRGVHASVPLSPAERDPDSEVDTRTDPLAAFHGGMEHLLGDVDLLRRGMEHFADEIDVLILELGKAAGSGHQDQEGEA